MFKNRGLNSQQIDYIRKHYPENVEDILDRFDRYIGVFNKRVLTDDEVKRLSREVDITIRIEQCSDLFTFTDFRKKVLNVCDDAWLFMVIRDASLARVALGTYKQYLDATADSLGLIKKERWNAVHLNAAYRKLTDRQHEYATFMEIIEEVERTS